MKREGEQMKKSNQNIESEISKTMRLFDEMLPLEVDPLFKVRLMQRIEKLPVQGRGNFDFRLAFVSLLVIINIGFTLLSFQNNERQKTIATISELAENQSDDYTSQEFAYYDQVP